MFNLYHRYSRLFEPLNFSGGADMSGILEKMIENGNVLNSEVHKNAVGESWLLDGILYLGKSFIGFIGTAGSTLEPIFVVVAICGFFLVMAGFDIMGKKLVGGSIVGYVACKVCEAIC